jgi:hypothetical protein
MADCTVSGTLYRVDNTPFGSQRRALTVVEVVKSGSLYMAVPLARDTNASGVVSFTVPQGSTAYVAADARGLNTNAAAGVALTIPSAATANLEDLVAATNIPAEGLTVKDEGTALASLIGALNFVGAGVSVAQTSAGAATVTITGGAGGGAWGGITGTLSDQTDLNTALGLKAASVHVHAESDVTGLVADLLTLTNAVAGKQGTLTNSAGLLAALSDETGTGLAVFNTSPTFVTPILGTPTSGTLTNCTLPIGGVTGLATGVGTFLATPTSANLLAAVTNETGSGALVFATSPTLVTPLLGTPTSGVLTNCTGLPPVAGIVGWPANASGVLTNDGSGGLTWGAAGSGANTALSNLASVAVNTSLLPASTQSLGSATFPWLSSFTGNTTQYESVVQTAGVITHAALGSATNIDIALTPKGSGGIRVCGGSYIWGSGTQINVGNAPGNFVCTLGAYGFYCAAISTPTQVLSQAVPGVGLSSGDKITWASGGNALSGMDLAVTRTGANVLEVNAGTAGTLGFLLAGRVVTAKTSNYTVVTADKSTLFTNAGAAGTVVFTLPAAVAGNTYEFYRDANFTVQITAGASTTIRVGTTVTAAAGNVTLDAVGSRIRLVAISTTSWVGDLTGTATFT